MKLSQCLMGWRNAPKQRVHRPAAPDWVNASADASPQPAGRDPAGLRLVRLQSRTERRAAGDRAPEPRASGQRGAAGLVVGLAVERAWALSAGCPGAGLRPGLLLADAAIRVDVRDAFCQRVVRRLSVRHRQRQALNPLVRVGRRRIERQADHPQQQACGQPPWRGAPAVAAFASGHRRWQRCPAPEPVAASIAECALHLQARVGDQRGQQIAAATAPMRHRGDALPANRLASTGSTAAANMACPEMPV